MHIHTFRVNIKNPSGKEIQQDQKNVAQERNVIDPHQSTSSARVMMYTHIKINRKPQSHNCNGAKKHSIDQEITPPWYISSMLDSNGTYNIQKIRSQG